MGSLLVVGGAKGIGRAVVEAFCAEGHAVTLADVDESSAVEVVRTVPAGSAHFVRCDIGRPEGPNDAVTAAVAFGGGLDTVLVTAGVLTAHPLEGWSLDEWDRTMAVNLRGPFFLVQAAAPHLRRSPNPSVILTASTGAFRGHAGMPAYAASKAGIVNLVRALADELSPDGVRVNAICPGWIDTPFNDVHWAHQTDPEAARIKLETAIPMRRQGAPADVLGAVQFLASESSAYVTGTSLVIDGGYLAP
jgi:NAD(P)-dependent dehydrogenase (short-subunit alcohol dehydrogenase family)